MLVKLNMKQSHGIGEIAARAANKKYYLSEGVRDERVNEGGDFLFS